MFTELRRIIHSAKASDRNRRIAAVLHVVLWPVLLIPRLLWPWRRRGAIERILLIRVDGIGDLAMCAAIFPGLRQKFPHAQIDLLSSENAAPVAELFVAEGWLNHVWRMPLKERGLKPYRKLAKDFRRVKAHLAEADQWLAEQGVVADRPLCAMHLGAFYPVKEWPLERFAAVAQRLYDLTGAQIVAIGGPPEAEHGKALAAQVNFPVALAAGKPSLGLA